MNINIQNIEYNDFINIENVGSQCLPIYYKIYDLLQFNESPKYIMLKATVNNNTVGFIITEKKNDHLHIMSIGVLEKYRKNYIGSSLINFIKEKYDKITLFVQASNNIGIQFYKKNLFIETTLLKNYYEDLDCNDAFLYTYEK